MKKLIAPLLTVLLLIGLAAGIYISVQEQLHQHSIITVRGLIGSEKENFFRDARVIAALAKQGIIVETDKAGSRQIAAQLKQKPYDFAFPSGAPAAKKIENENKVAGKYEVFFTPMAVASWKDIAEILEANDMVKQRDGTYYIIDMPKLLQISIAEKRWSDLASNAKYNVKKSLLLGTTDVRQSNSAAMYLSLVSYILNNNNIVSDAAQITPIITKLQSLFLRQGFMESSSATPFNDYLVMGAGKAPLVMIYESQYLEEASRPNSGISDKMVLLYPEPTIFTKHILLAFNDNANRLGAALMNDPELQQLAIEHGFRNQNSAGFRNFIQSKSLSVPDSLVNVIEPPTFEMLEQMTVLIEQRYKGN